jgi:four helix bundle protein
MSLSSDADGEVSASPQWLADRLIDFAVGIGGLVEKLPESRLGRHVAGQLIRSGTSAAPNYQEACAAESRRDFVHKLGICLKELRESHCWLKIIARSALVPQSLTAIMRDECEQLSNIIGKSIVTAKRGHKIR